MSYSPAHSSFTEWLKWCKGKVRRPCQEYMRSSMTKLRDWLPSLPFQQFQVLYLSFHSFQSSLHLSLVSRQYLALDGIYHVLRERDNVMTKQTLFRDTYYIPLYTDIRPPFAQ